MTADVRDLNLTATPALPLERTGRGGVLDSVQQNADAAFRCARFAGAQDAASFYLHPGKLFVAIQPTVVTTILGSCVAVCLWDAELGIGGINHYLLPAGLKAAASPLRYGNVAIEELLSRTVRAGARRASLRAKLFGGACVLEAMRGRDTHLGTKNIEMARKALTEAGIPIIASDVGGNRGRKLIFQPHDGTALVKLL